MKRNTRVKALLNRKQKLKDSLEYLRIRDIEIDIERRLVIYKEGELILPKKEFELLLLLVSIPEKVFSRKEIFKEIWRDDVIVGERTIDVHIRKLRKKMGNDYIKTSKGFGYSFSPKQ